MVVEGREKRDSHIKGQILSSGECVFELNVAYLVIIVLDFNCYLYS